MKAKPKLPAAKLNRLYWLDELNQSQIAKRYKCTSQNVQQSMRRHQVPTRKPRRKIAECAVEGCEEPTCQVKRWSKRYKHGVRFVWTDRCSLHFHEHWRQVQRESAERRRRRRGLPRGHRHGGCGGNLGDLSTIVRTDD